MKIIIIKDISTGVKDRIICGIWWSFFYWQHPGISLADFFSTASGHSYGSQQCSFFNQLVPLFAWSRLQEWGSQEKTKKASAILKFHALLYWWCNCWILIGPRAFQQPLKENHGNMTKYT